MREIGGYIEIEHFSGPILHAEAAALNCARAALTLLLRAREIKRLLIPRFICESVTGACERAGVPYTLYGVGRDFLPAEEMELGAGEWLYLVNYYSQLSNSVIRGLVEKYRRVIVDNAQSYFQPPLPGVDTLYTCRKYFGVADGAFLYTGAALPALARDESHTRMGFLLGRFERPAAEFYAAYAANNDFFDSEPPKVMSRLTENLLRAVDYEAIERRRRDNFQILHERLGERNGLRLPETGSFMYPFYTENGAAVRKKLQAEKIYIPTLWPDVFRMSEPGSTEYAMAENILPLPIDQRYGAEDMTYMLNRLERLAAARPAFT